MNEKASILTINGGSSSIKFALYEAVKPLKRGLHGTVDRIGLSGTNLTFHDVDGKPPASRKFVVADHKSAANSLIDWLEKQIDFKSVKGVGHNTFFIRKLQPAQNKGLWGQFAGNC
jgi:acetate kinase